MQKKHTAIVAVNKDWVNTASHLVNNGRFSQSTGQVHQLIADLEDANDPRGLWLANITTDQITTKDGTPITMNRFFIPWSFVYALGVVEEEQAKVKHGFTSIPIVPPEGS